LDKEEVARRGSEIYRSKLRTLVESEENIGKFLSLDVKSGVYEIRDDLLSSALALRATRPDAICWTENVGYKTAIAFGGSTKRSEPE
jgi:hypothetical protein